MEVNQMSVRGDAAERVFWRRSFVLCILEVVL